MLKEREDGEGATAIYSRDADREDIEEAEAEDGKKECEASRFSNSRGTLHSSLC